ncbi:Protein maelstrom like protein [Eufriesea mexicana]|uniref:Protein maelstrom like protein n=1 Tax=Eufriesea mexicana TaxID=516756 RepID=A0A310SH33_9HYME|nr:PREDICTED: protein maelstrom homolog [Eufriesea mexicana]OAD57991.1 Protein maelstrom like protein [Eufriesea mexicana]
MAKNAFYFFMRDWAQDQERRGLTVSGRLADIAADPRCSEAWKNLSEQQKGVYKAKAKNSKIRAQGSASKKTTIGENLTDLERNERKQQEFQQNMLQYIDSVVSMGMQHNNLHKLKFIFIHVNWFYKREIGINKYEFCPAEFAVAEFNLQNGVKNIYHEVLNVKIPLGWKRDAIETSQESHQIPIELTDGQSDFSLMFKKLTKFLEYNKIGNKFPPLFTTKNVTLAVETLLTKMTNAGNGSLDDFLIYSIEALFGALWNAVMQNVNDHSIPLVVAENEFSKDVFSTERGFECDFHKIIDVCQYCSKSTVTRWGFIICDHCCESLNIEMIEGMHCPFKKSILDLPDQDSTSQETSAIDIQLKCMSISNQKQVVEMNGVSLDHRRRVSERNYRDEQRRRNECKPLEIIDYDKCNTSNLNSSRLNIPTRPLRLPKTKPQVLSDLENSIDLLDTDNFPSLDKTYTSKK